VIVEAVEGRTMFALFNVVTQAFTPGVPQLVFTDIANGSTNGSSATASQAIKLQNTTGGSSFQVTAAQVVDDSSIAGDDAAQFELVNTSLPLSAGPGATATVNVRFRAASVGLHAAILHLTTTAPSQPNVDVYLRGIGTTSDSSGDVGGSNEASLQRILHAFQLPINVGDANGEDTYDLPTPRPAGTASDEVEMQRLVKSGSGPVVIQPLAEYAFNTGLGKAVHLGYYTPGTTQAKTELFSVDSSEHTSTSPSWSASFDPGSSAFGLYGDFNGKLFEINNLPRGVYSEDVFNSFDAVNKKKVRFFPLKNKDGSVVPDAFVFAFEEFNAGYDSNDVVGVIRNVKAAPTGAEIGTENLDRGTPGPSRLVFSRIQQQPPTTVDPVTGEEIPLPNNIVHDKASVRIWNSGTSALTIASVTLSNTTDFQINSTGLSGLTLQPGGSKDVEVQFIAQSGDLRSGTLTFNSNDSDEPALQVQLSGFWQNRSEHGEEPNLEELVQLMGFGTKIVNAGETLNIAGDEGRVRKVGDEVLSPYWRNADPARNVEVIQLNAFHTHDQEESFTVHKRGSFTTTTVFTHAALDAQSVLPHKKDSTSVAAGTFKVDPVSGDNNPAFGFKIGAEWSDPTRNKQEKPGGGYGHHVRFWVAKDSSGKVIPNTYIMGMDYSGINYDYQDNLYLIKNVTPADAGAAPGAPTQLSATPSTSGIALDWADNPESGIAGYNLYRGASADFTPSASNRLNSGLLTTSAFDDTAAPPGATSFYKVTAVDTANQESAAASTSATRPDQGPGTPNAPTDLNATATSSSTINLSWTGSAGADHYVVERRGGGVSSFTVIADQATGTSFGDAGLNPNTTYEYRVSAVRNSAQSTPSGVASAKTSNVAQGPPSVSVSSTSVSEPTGGNQAHATFTISLSAPSSSDIVLNYATGDGSAVAGSDYSSTSGTLSFPAGVTSRTVDVPVLADAQNESAENFFLNVSVATGNATIADGQGSATIVSANVNPPPVIPFGNGVVATFTGANGKPVKISIKGPGTGEAILMDGGAVILSLQNTTEKSALTISGLTTIQGATVAGSLKSFTGKTVDIAGDIAVNGSVGKLTLRNANSGAHHALSIGNGGTSTTVTLGDVADLSLLTGSAIKSVKASAWRDTESTAESIVAASVGSIAVKGDFTPDVTAGSIGKMSVSGAIAGSEIRASGDIGSVKAIAMHDSRLFAGVQNAVSTLPDSSDDFSAASTIKSVSVSGKTAGAFSNTLIAATNVGKVSLGSVNVANGGVAFGVAGDNISAVRASTPDLP
jgi:hypothetical protein